MAYDGWVTFNDVELVNISRTAQLAETLSIPSVWTTPEAAQWIQDSLAGVDYDDITTAPWYDSGFPASAEFAGIMPLGMPGLDDSTLTSATVELLGDGGRSGRVRNATLPIVVSAAIIASTERGAAYGKRWLDRVLKGSGDNLYCAGADLRYFQFNGEDGSTPPQSHRRNVRTTRGATITRKRRGDCSSTWWVTFTMTANDPYEYSDPASYITTLGPGSTSGPKVTSSGATALVQASCVAFDYTPLYDPLYPALVPPPAIPDFYPDGWDVTPGMTFDRFWAVVSPDEPSSLNVIPTLVLSAASDNRMVRVSIWPGLSDPTLVQCDPLFSVMVTYLPAGIEFTIDSEQQASYVWDGISAIVRRSDSLVYAPDARPVQWTAFNDPDGFLVTIDLFSESGLALGSDAQVAVLFTSKSD